MNHELAQTIDNLLTPQKGILASDESVNSANRNLAKVGVEGNLETRRAYRELFINTPGFEKYVSGMILFDETFWQSDSTGKPMVQTLLEKEIVPIIKVDEGLRKFPGHEGEQYTAGLDSLEERLPKYFEAGARGAKWRTIFKIGEGTPSDALIDANAHSLAMYSLLCQQNGIVPLVEPEVLFKGDHSFVEAQDVTSKVLRKVYEKLNEYGVNLRYTILKSSMVLPGKDSGEAFDPDEIAAATIDVFRESVPEEVPGIVFLSGGQDTVMATNNLNAIALANNTEWFMTFSFLRAIEGPAAEVWRGKPEKVEEARHMFLSELEKDSLAIQGLL